MHKKYLLLAVSAALCVFVPSALGTTYYLDGSVSTSGNGLSWSSAWKGFSSITGLNPGDTVYISGGATSQTYALNGWLPTSGNSSARITYAVGQDAGHNGTVIFTGGTTGWATVVLKPCSTLRSTDVGSDGTNRMAVNGYSDYPIYCESGTVCKFMSFLHINFTETAGFRFGNSAGIELGYNSIIKSYWGSNGSHDDLIWACQESSPGAYDCLIHDNYIQIPVSNVNSAYGDDGIKWGSGISFYNNHVKAMLGTYSTGSGAQHADGFQVNESHYKVYGNLFEDIGESNFYHDDFDTPRNIEGVFIYNNLFAQSHTPGTDVPRGIDILPENNGIGTTFTDVVIANNEWVDCSGYMYTVRFQSIASCSNCRFEDNIDSDNVGTDIVSVPVTVSNNTSSAKWVSYSRYAVNSNNLHLASGDTVNVGHASNLSAYFTTDKDGHVRPSTGTWDVGAYELVSSTSAPNPPQVLLPQYSDIYEQTVLT